MSKEKSSPDKKTPVSWLVVLAVIAGVTTGVIIGITLRFKLGPQYKSIEDVFSHIFSLNMLYVCISLLVGVFIGLKKRTYKAVWTGAIIGSFIMLAMIGILFLALNA